MNSSCSHLTNYATDLTDAEWAIVAPSVNHDPKLGPPCTVCMRWVMHALVDIDKTGWTQRVPRNVVPKDLPTDGPVYDYFRKWTDDGTCARMHTDLRRLLRTRDGRAADPSRAMVDRQSVQTTAVGGELGDDAGKQGKGRTRHRLVDTLGVLLLVVVTAASVQDASSATSIGPRMQGRVPRLQKILANHGYQQQGIEWFHTRYAWIVEMVQRPPQQRGFQVLPTRWIVERTLAWVDPYRRLSKDDE